MIKKYKLAGVLIIVLAIIGASGMYFHDHSLAVLDPQGPIAYKERQLIIVTVLLSFVVVVPVFVLLFVIAWKYRESNTKATYTPDWDHNRLAETIWWVIPSLLILVIGIITWNSSHQLDPFKPLTSNSTPLTIQVVALDWKWLFIYPEQNIATVNYVQFPQSTPLNFEITSDATMNSFWIPQLGGQIYAMAGMSTRLHLMADKPGDFRGTSANISGQGFAGMKFTARSSSRADFTTWVQTIKQSPEALTTSEYAKLAAPSVNNSPAYYSSEKQDLYTTIIRKYMTPAEQMSDMQGMVMP